MSEIAIFRQSGRLLRVRCLQYSTISLSDLRHCDSARAQSPAITLPCSSLQCSSRLGTAAVRAKRPTWGSSITISKSFAPELRRNRTDSNVIPFTFNSTCRTSARWGLFIRPPELRTTFWADQRCLALLDESLAGNFNDPTFRLQKVQLAKDVIGHKLANRAVGQHHKFSLQDRSHAE